MNDDTQFIAAFLIFFGLLFGALLASQWNTNAAKIECYKLRAGSTAAEIAVVCGKIG